MDKLQQEGNNIEINKRIQTLVSQLNTYRDEYYNQNKPSVTDAEYDHLFDELKALEKQTGIILGNSPTQEVGYPVADKLKKAAHTIPLRSLSKTKNLIDIETFIGEQPSLLMLKYDGLTVELIYENGALVQASTRGDGYTGEDITHNARTFHDLPLTIPYKEHLKVVGEAIILESDFKAINEKLSVDDKYKTPRNLASGSVRQIDRKLCAERKIRFALWDILEGFGAYNSRLQKINSAVKCGFAKPKLLAVSFKTEDSNDKRNLPKMVEELKQYAESNFIPIDGLVIKYDDIEYSKSLGSTSHHNNDGLALKFEDETADTILREIEWSMGRTGQLTPVAIFDTVDLDNTEVSRASLHNISIIEKLELGIGDTIVVAKANQIIPQIVDNITRSQSLAIPSVCPVCGGRTKIIQDDESKMLICTNRDCKGQLLGKFVHFVSKSCMDIDGLSEATLEKFINKRWLVNFKDIYSLSQYRDEIICMDGLGEKSYAKLIKSIDSSKSVKLDNFIPSLCIHNVGKTAGKALSKQFLGSFNGLIAAYESGYDFMQIPGFGGVMVDSLNKYFSENIDMLRGLAEYLFFQLQGYPTSVRPNNPLVGKTVVVTGSLKNFTRNSIQEKLEELGARVSGSVSKNTYFLIAGEDAGSKLVKAQSLGVKILTEAEFLNQIKE